MSGILVTEILIIIKMMYLNDMNYYYWQKVDGMTLNASLCEN